MTYEPSTAKSRLKMGQRRARELIERGRRHRTTRELVAAIFPGVGARSVVVISRLAALYF